MLVAMIRAGAGTSHAETTSRAAADAVEAALRDLGGARPAAALLAVTPQHARDFEKALRFVEDATDGAVVVGASVDGILASGRESETGPAVGVWMVAGVEAHGVLVHDVATAAAAAGEEILGELGRAPTAEDLLLLLPDPARCDLGRVLGGVRAHCGAAAVVGLGAADAGEGAACVAGHGEVVPGGLAALWLGGARPPRVGVTSSCQPVAGPFVVTRAEGHWVLALDGRPALDVYREAAREPLARDLQRALAHVLVATAPRRSAGLEDQPLVVRDLAGISSRKRGFALPEAVTRGQQLSFVLRDGVGARDGLRGMLTQLATPPAAGGLYLACRERGAALFGMEGLEAAYLEHLLPDAAILGLRGSCEIGPTADGPALLTHAAVLSLLPA